MWLSQRSPALNDSRSISVGYVSIGGNPSSILTDSESRNVFLVTPGGYSWKPKIGQNVLVLKCADGEDVVSGVYSLDNLSDLNDGDVRIASDNAEIILRNNGDISVSGNLSIKGDLIVNGVPYSPLSGN